MHDFLPYVGPILQLLTLVILPLLGRSLRAYIREEVERTNAQFKSELISHIEETALKDLRHDVKDTRAHVMVLMSKRSALLEDVLIKVLKRDEQQRDDLALARTDDKR
jgi:hypothetical protein